MFYYSKTREDILADIAYLQSLTRETPFADALPLSRDLNLRNKYGVWHEPVRPVPLDISAARTFEAARTEETVARIVDGLPARRAPFAKRPFTLTATIPA